MEQLIFSCPHVCNTIMTECSLAHKSLSPDTRRHITWLSVKQAPVFSASMRGVWPHTLEVKVQDFIDEAGECNRPG